MALVPDVLGISALFYITKKAQAGSRKRAREPGMIAAAGPGVTFSWAEACVRLWWWCTYSACN
jgi:hypothetical protein